MWGPSISCEASPITQADEGDLMTSTRTRTIRLLGVAAVVTLGLNAAAYGATGGTFLLGKANKADQTTSLRNTGDGAALSVRSQPGEPPLAVSSGTKVAKLNADAVDGISAQALQTRSTVYKLPNTGYSGVTSFDLDLSLEPGLYHVDYTMLADMTPNGAQLNCSFVGDSPYAQLLGYGTTFNGFSVVSGSGVLDTRDSDRLLRCFSDDGEAEMYVEQSQIAVTPIDALTTTTLPVPAP